MRTWTVIIGLALFGQLSCSNEDLDIKSFNDDSSITTLNGTSTHYHRITAKGLQPSQSRVGNSLSTSWVFQTLETFAETVTNAYDDFVNKHSYLTSRQASEEFLTQKKLTR